MALGVLCAFCLSLFVRLAQTPIESPSIGASNTITAGHEDQGGIGLQRKSRKRQFEQKDRPSYVPFETSSFPTDPIYELKALSFMVTDECKSLLELDDDQVKQVQRSFDTLFETLVNYEYDSAEVHRISANHVRLEVPRITGFMEDAQAEHEKSLESALGPQKANVLGLMAQEVYYEQFSDFGRRVRILEGEKIRGKWRILHSFSDGDKLIIVRGKQSRIQHLLETLKQELK